MEALEQTGAEGGGRGSAGPTKEPFPRPPCGPLPTATPGPQDPAAPRSPTWAGKPSQPPPCTDVPRHRPGPRGAPPSQDRARPPPFPGGREEPGGQRPPESPAATPPGQPVPVSSSVKQTGAALPPHQGQGDARTSQSGREVCAGGLPAQDPTRVPHACQNGDQAPPREPHHCRRRRLADSSPEPVPVTDSHPGPVRPQHRQSPVPWHFLDGLYEPRPPTPGRGLWSPSPSGGGWGDVV